MRRGRALAPHPQPRPYGNAGLLVTRHGIVHLHGVHLSAVRRAETRGELPPVACDVATRTVLYDLDRADEWASTRR